MRLRQIPIVLAVFALVPAVNLGLEDLGLGSLEFAGDAFAEDAELAPKLRNALVRVHVTSQGYDTTSPWKMSREGTRNGRGVVIAPGVILTRASHVADQRMIEVSIVNSARRYPAKLKHVDQRLDLALIEITDEGLKAQMQPLPLGDPIKLDDELEIHQLGRDNMLERFTARVVRANARSTRLSLTVKTNCADRGDGQVALKDGKIVGLVTGTWGSRQEGTILSLETIRHYLDDFDDDSYDGVPGGGPWWQALLRRDLRTYFGVTEDQHGIGITRVSPGRTGEGVLEAGDVILSLDGFDLDDEGMFIHPTHGRLDSGYLLQGRRYVGDKIKATVLRKGETLDVELELKGKPAGEKQIPDGAALEARPQFVMAGGLVILELTAQSPISRSPGGVLLRRYRERANWDPPSERKRIIYVDRVMADKANKGQDGVMHAPIVSINGVTIDEVKDVLEALKSPQGKYHVFRFEGVSADFVIPADDLDAINRRVAETYKITRTQHLRGADDE